MKIPRGTVDGLLRKAYTIGSVSEQILGSEGSWGMGLKKPRRRRETSDAG